MSNKNDAAKRSLLRDQKDRHISFPYFKVSGKLKLRNSLRLKNYIMHCKITLDSMSLESGIELSDSEIPLKFWNRRT